MLVNVVDFSRSGWEISSPSKCSFQFESGRRGLSAGIGIVPLDISGPFWAQGGSRCAETTSAPVTNEFEETLRRSGARAKGTGTWWYLVVFQFLFFFGWPAGSPRCSIPQKNLRCLAYLRLPSCPIISSPQWIRQLIFEGLMIPTGYLSRPSSRNRWRTHGLNGLASSDRKWETTDINRSLPCGFSMWNPQLAERPGFGRKSARQRRVFRGLWTPKMLHDWGSLVHSGSQWSQFSFSFELWDIVGCLSFYKSNRTGLKIFIHSRFIFCRSHVVSEPQRAGLMCCPSSSRRTQLLTPPIFLWTFSTHISNAVPVVIVLGERDHFKKKCARYIMIYPDML